MNFFSPAKMKSKAKIVPSVDRIAFNTPAAWWGMIHWDIMEQRRWQRKHKQCKGDEDGLFIDVVVGGGVGGLSEKFF